jgi:DNA-binding NtrC family response regulator/tetratricopeptide (TPR) repeat protein
MVRSSSIQPLASQPSETPISDSVSFFGRDSELDRILKAFAEAQKDRSGRVVVVSGEEGIGKSRLFSELRRRLEAEGVVVVQGRCRLGTGPAPTYRPVADILESTAEALRRGGHIGPATRAGEVLEALQGRARQEGAMEEHWEVRRAALFEQVASLLADAARELPLGILIHDLDVADRATMELVTHLMQTRFSSPELEGGTEEDRFVGLLAVSAREIDERWLTGIRADLLRLAPFDSEGVRAFLQSPEVVAFFAEATGGRPRALEALLESPPADADQLIRNRAAHLSVESRSLLQALAVHGRPAAVERLARFAGLEEAALAPALVEIARSRLAKKRVVDGELRLGFLRSTDEAAIYGSIDESERIVLHATIGRHLRSLDGDEDPAVIAEHLLRGAAGEEAVEAALEACERLELTFGFERAIELYRRAHAMTMREPLRSHIEGRLCQLERLVGDFAAALETAEQLRRRNPDAAAHRRLAEIHVLRDEVDLAIEAFDTALRLSVEMDDELECARIHAARAEALVLAGRLDEAKAACDKVLELDPGEPEMATRRLSVHQTLGKVLLATGAYHEAAAVYSSTVREARALGSAFDEIQALCNLGIAQLRLGDHAQAAARYQAALKVAESAGDHRSRAFCLQNLGVLSHWKNDYAAALAYFHEAVSAFKKIGQRARLAWLALDIASLYLDLNDIDRAEAMAVLADQFSGGSLPKAVEIGRQQIAGRLFIGRGELDAAEQHLERAEGHAEAAGDLERRAAALVELARIELARGRLDDVERRLERIERPSAIGTRAKIEQCRGELAIARGEPEAARRLLLSALELHRQSGDLEGEWRAQYWIGRAAQACSDEAEAERRFRTAFSISARVRERVPGEVRASFDADPIRQELTGLLNRRSEGPRLPASAPARVREGTMPVRASSPPPAPPQTRYPSIIGRHPKLLQVLGLIDKVAPYDSQVLIRGESGTGKELIADAIHFHSTRRDRAFVKVNCGALVESLLLSELFGHERGAFTGALQRKKGRFEAADGGTIFLDEIGDISPKTQVALLRVLQERIFERVGGTSPVKVDVRIICATNRNLEQMVARGEFREDLYYRLKGIQIELPPLRERIEDIGLLAQAVLDRVAAERGHTPKSLSSEALALLRQYTWPGNIRELENVLRSVSLFCDEDVLVPRDFADYTEVFSGQSTLPSKDSLEINAVNQQAGDPSRIRVSSAWTRLADEKLSLKELKTRIEVECITEALIQTGGNITKAAEKLGMKRPRLSQLIKEHGIAIATESEGDR